MSEYSSRSNCSVAVCFPEKSSWCWNELVCQRVNCKNNRVREETGTQLSLTKRIDGYGSDDVGRWMSAYGGVSTTVPD